MNAGTQQLTVIKKMLNKGHARTANARKNILASFLIKGCNIAIGLLLVPLTIHYVNATRYGIWLTLSSIIGWLGFFDIGLGNGLRNKFAEALAKGDHAIARVYVSTTYAILTIIISITLLVFFCVNPFLNWTKILNAPAEMAGELSLLAIIVFSSFALRFVLQLITTILTADQKPARASLFNLFGSAFSLAVIFILTRTTSGNLIYLGLGLAFTPVLVFCTSSLWFYSGDYKRYAPSLKHVDFRLSRSLMGLGLKFFVIQIAAIILYETANIIISQLFGPAEVTPYNIAYRYFGIISMVFSIIMTPYWSAFTEAWHKKDMVWIRSTMRKLDLLSIAGIGVILLMLAVSSFAFRIWVGKDVTVPIGISIVLAAYFIVYVRNMVYIYFLNGVGAVKLQLYSSVAGMIVNIPLAIFLGRRMGVAGVLLSSVILNGINTIWTVIQYKKIINNKATGIWAQ
ncbi:MAG: oligosaccharide flippase family protein [Bacteroidetes bacterium]|nr:oligosaccharide flippase family protein [Bacteroidota bacterium]